MLRMTTRSMRALRLWIAVLLACLPYASAGIAAEPIEITITIRNHRFEPDTVEVPAGQEIKLLVTNADSTPEEFESVGLKIERVIRPGQTAEFRLRPLLANRNYKFFGEHHPKTAQGQLIVK